MRKIIEMKNDKIGLKWIEFEPRPQRMNSYVASLLKKLRKDEIINNYGYVYRVRKINV